MKPMCVLLLSLVSLPLTSGAQAPDAKPIRATGSFFALAVDDLEASTRWYAEKLGLRIVMQVPGQGAPAVRVLEGDGLLVELVEHRGPAQLDKVPPGLQANPRIQGMFKAGFLVEDFDATIATLRSRGVTFAFGPFPPRRDQRANAVFRDNAGNLVQVLGDYAP